MLKHTKNEEQKLKEPVTEFYLVIFAFNIVLLVCYFTRVHDHIRSGNYLR